ncbi:outer dynein arm-docking complex subunit 4-like [Haliotis rufescens]|uniref:outer dynein arm-docking complex subunit 4-like n=1 Tax=Haliotis rufescens TaxID=6454 RepID=UPI00201F896B|nr:outer dynein arm-docking complex subunit 4-like [Haliotis rufescens]
MYEDDRSSEGPRGTFEIYKAEADSLFKQGEYRKSIESYTTALELQRGDKSCLVARSKCHLQLGDTKNALVDAEASLEEDKTFHKGVYQKAEALYYKGDFEMALVFYHRGHKLRPELQEFRLGIQKAQEAIDNSVGTPEKVKLNTSGDLSFFQDQDDKQKRKRQTYGSFARQNAQQQSKQKRDTTRSQASERTIKQMLGELYGDRKYLELLLKETDATTSTGKTISDLVEEGLSYLDTRTDFWRQQKPMYTRLYERREQRRRRNSGNKGQSPQDYVMSELERIDEAQLNGKTSESLKRAEKCLATVQNYGDDAIPNKLEVTANLHSYIGNAHLDMGNYEKALHHHGIDLDIGEKNKLTDAVSRGLDNLGRVHARSGSFEKAIQVWERKLPLTKSSLENTWLYHEIGRCHLELREYADAKNYGEKSLAASEDAQDMVWQLQATVLIAQAQVKLSDLQGALVSFEKAMDLAMVQDDRSAEVAIKKAIDEVNNKIVQSLKAEKEGGASQEKTGEETGEEQDDNQDDNMDDNKAAEEGGTA